LWDDAAGRFRDWDKRAGAFVRPAGRPVYWDADPGRYSPLSLTPLLDGVATPEQARRLGDELPAYDVAPWCDWPSWTYAIVESAAAAGYHAFAAHMAARIVERVWRRVDRRDLHGYARPLPGVAPEYWPTDAMAYTGSDGYGWGATTLSLLLRQVIGLTESEITDRWAVHLTPGLPDALLVPGREPAELLSLVPQPTDEQMLDSGLVLLGYEWPADARPGSRVRFATFWRLQETPAAERGVVHSLFNHLLAADGQKVTQRDGFGLPERYWRPGLMLVQWFELELPPEAPAGDYTLLTGMYRLSDLSRNSVVDESNAPIGDSIRLGPVRVLGG
ncbi:MAG: hypothetical protein K6V36_05900, partial [Anaerolineae bacterium]|nr:hypothetical protein [Anaerolineae bacterium]